MLNFVNFVTVSRTVVRTWRLSDFKDGLRASSCILNNSNFYGLWVKMVNMHHRANIVIIGQTDGDFSIFQNGGRPPSWICCAYVWTTHEEYLVVFIVVQNLVGISNIL